MVNDTLPVSLKFEGRYLEAVFSLNKEICLTNNGCVDEQKIQQVLSKVRFSHQDKECGSMEEEYSLNQRMYEMVSYYLTRVGIKAAG